MDFNILNAYQSVLNNDAAEAGLPPPEMSPGPGNIVLQVPIDAKTKLTEDQIYTLNIVGTMLKNAGVTSPSNVGATASSWNEGFSNPDLLFEELGIGCKVKIMISNGQEIIGHLKVSPKIAALAEIREQYVYEDLMVKRLLDDHGPVVVVTEDLIDAPVKSKSCWERIL